MKPKVNIRFPNIDQEIESKMVTALTEAGFEVSFSYNLDDNYDFIEILFQKKMPKEPILRIISLLENFLKNKIGYIGTTEEVSCAEFYLKGINTACQYLGVDMNEDIHSEVIEERGWTPSDTAYLNEIKEKGYTNQEIINELIAIDIDTWKRMYSLLEADE